MFRAERGTIAAMPQICLAVHPDGLLAIEAVKAYHNHTDGGQEEEAAEGEDAGGVALERRRVLLFAAIIDLWR